MRDFPRARLCCRFLSFLLLLAIALPAGAQTFDATALTSPVDLAAGWRVHAGDDPAFAIPSFDDSHWPIFDARYSVRAVIPTGQPPVVWYRLHIKVNPGQEGLALRESTVASAFEIYLNGHRILQTGSIVPFKPSTFDGRLLVPISKADAASGTLLLSLRVHISRYEWSLPTPGLFSPNLTLGQYAALQNADWLQVVGDNAIYWLNRFTWLGIGIVALALYAAHRAQREYLWLFLSAFCWALDVPFAAAHYFHNFSPNWDLVRQLFNIASIAFEMLMYAAILRVRLRRWAGAIMAIAAAGLIVDWFVGGVESLSETARLLAIAPLFILLTVVLPVVLWVHFRRGNREAGILLIAALVQSLWIYVAYGLLVFGMVPATRAVAAPLVIAVNSSHWGPFLLDFDSISSMLSVLALSVIIVLRATRVSRQQALIETELEAARQVQQVILPESIEAIPGFHVETVYHPAQQVGGDFFQIIPAGSDGMLVVVGDVAGKGLPAAMLVSVLVGAIRGVATYTSDPAELLANLNERMVGRSGGGFSTALVAHISAGGQVSIANAGHLPPYLDGAEMELPGALPLGVQSGVRYDSIHFRLQPGSRLTFVSDGVVEAQNKEGELFGFDRSRELSRNPAAEIAGAAQRFGQQDDITVVVVERSPVGEPVARAVPDLGLAGAAS